MEQAEDLAQIKQASGEVQLHESCAVLSTAACIDIRLNIYISMYTHVIFMEALSQAACTLM